MSLKDMAIIAIKCEWETVPKLSNSTSVSDLQWPLTQISRSRHYLIQIVSEMVRDTDSYNGILTGTYAYSRVSFRMTLNKHVHKASHGLSAIAELLVCHG